MSPRTTLRTMMLAMLAMLIALPAAAELRLRITPAPYHSDADIEHLVNSLHSLWAQCALARAVA